MSQPHPELIPGRIPLAYLITFRAHGTWLHGDSRGSVDRFRNRHGTPLIRPDRRWRRYNERTLKIPPVKLDARRALQRLSMLSTNRVNHFLELLSERVAEIDPALPLGSVVVWSPWSIVVLRSTRRYRARFCGVWSSFSNRVAEIDPALPRSVLWCVVIFQQS